MKMSLIVLTALGISLLLRGRSAALRHWVLAAGVGAAAIMPLVGSVVPVWSLPFAAPTAFAPHDDGFRSVGQPPTRATSASGAGAAPTSVQPPSASRRFDWRGALQIAWVAGATIGVAILVVGLLRLTWLAARARRVTEGRWHGLASEISGIYGLRSPVTVLQSDHPTLLVTWGLAHPKVILPAEAAGWTDDRARVVLSHELAHISRGDWIVQLSAELLRAFYWFNPLLWIACRRLRLESEHACDDEVMNRGIGASDYATHLIELARALNQRRNSWVPAPAMARPSSLERRVRAMLNDHLDRRPVSGVTRAAISVLLLAAAGVVASAQSGFVTFSGSVVDESGLGVPGTSVVLTSDARQAKYEVKTNLIGRFEFIGLPSGDYGLEVQSAGFQALRDAVTISGQNLQRSYTLKLGTLQETINVVDDSRDQVAPSASSRVRERPAPKPIACTPSSAGGRIVPPKKIRDYVPIFPAGLRGSGTEGAVKMEARIGIDGRIRDVAIVGEAHPEMAHAAVEAVREWQFTQTLLNCQPVDVVMHVTVNFKAVPPPPPPPPPAPRP
jgi:beta-lactamase regulating signal transducer with metallopeptidase domain